MKRRFRFSGDTNITEVGVGGGQVGAYESVKFGTPIVVEPHEDLLLAMAHRIVELESLLAAEQEAQRW